MDERDVAFFEDIAGSIDRWAEAAAQGVRDPSSGTSEATDALMVLGAALDTPERRDAFEAVTRDTLIGLAHSVMVILDGGSAYSGRLGSPRLLHGDGQPFVSGLHEWFFEHLGRTGRLP